MVFQDLALFPHLTARREHRVRPAGSRGEPDEAGPPGRRARRIGSASRGLLDRYPDQISGASGSGSRWPGRWSRAPTAYLLDEPLSDLDAQLRVAGTGRDRRAAPRDRRDDDLRHARPGRGDDDGRPGGRAGRRPLAAGRPAGGRSTTSRRTSFVAGFVGSPPMNLVAGAAAGRLIGGGARRGRRRAAGGSRRSTPAGDDRGRPSSVVERAGQRDRAAGHRRWRRPARRAHRSRTVPSSPATGDPRSRSTPAGSTGSTRTSGARR